jgi:hypothetical protein
MHAIARFDERFLVGVHEATVFEHADDFKICLMPVPACAQLRRKTCPKKLRDHLVTLTISRSR